MFSTRKLLSYHMSENEKDRATFVSRLLHAFSESYEPHLFNTVESAAIRTNIIFMEGKGFAFLIHGDEEQVPFYPRLKDFVNAVLFELGIHYDFWRMWENTSVQDFLMTDDINYYPIPVDYRVRDENGTYLCYLYNGRLRYVYQKPMFRLDSSVPIGFEYSIVEKEAYDKLIESPEGTNIGYVRYLEFEQFEGILKEAIDLLVI